MTRDARLLMFILEYQIANGGVSPTFAEMADAIGVASKSSIHRVLRRLEAAGLVRVLRGHARAIEVTRQARIVLFPQDYRLVAGAVQRRRYAGVEGLLRAVDWRLGQGQLTGIE